MSIRGASASVRQGDFTREVYSWIRDGKWNVIAMSLIFN